MANGNGLLHCPFCGMEFERADTVCSDSCPLGAACEHVRCPSCSYEFPSESRLTSWFRGLFRRKPAVRPTTAGSGVALEQLRPGELGNVLELAGCMSPRRRSTLTAFGLTPGAEVTLLQRYPTYVIRVGETELGLDGDVAREIFVERG